MQQAGTQIDRLAQQSKTSGTAIERAFASIGGGVTNTFEAFRSGGVSGAIASVTSGVGGLVSQFTQLAGIGGTFVTGFVAGFSAVAELADRTAKAIADVGKRAAAVGETSGNQQVLDRVFRNAGLDPEAVNTISQRFFAKLGELRQSLATGGTGGETGDVLRRIGLDPQAFSQLRPAEAIETLTEQLRQVPNAYDRAAAAQALFGRAMADLLPVINRGSRAFADARADVRQSGQNAELTAAALEAQGLNRQTSREDRYGLWTGITRTWDEFSTGLSLARARAARGRAEAVDAVIDLFGGVTVAERVRRDEAGARQAPPEIRFDAAAARTRAANEAAERVRNTWRQTAEAVGLTTRETEILRQQQAGASQDTVQQLRAADALLVNAEARVARERELRGVLTSNRTAYERFSESLVSLNLNVNRFTGAEATRVLGASFRDLERAIGLGGRQDFAINGVNAGGVEAARILADREVRRNSGENDPQQRVIQVLEAAREIQAQQLEESRAIAEVLRNMPGFGIAPVRN